MKGKKKQWILHLVNDPGAVEVSILRGLPPAEASRGCAGAQWDLQRHQASLIAAVTEEEVLQKAPSQTSIHRELEQHRLRARVWGSLPTA